MSELAVGSLAGLAANSYVIDVASGSQLTQPGMVLQVVSTTKTDTFTTNSSSFTTITDLSVNITPVSASSKILISFSVPMDYRDNSLRNAFLAPFRNGTNLVTATAPSSRTPSFIGLNSYNDKNTQVGLKLISGSLLDSPSSTLSLTYDIRVTYHVPEVGRPILYVNRSESDTDGAGQPRGVATLTVMEIAG